MRILILNYEFPPLGGGAGNATYYLLKEFAKHDDLQIDLITSSLNNYKEENFAHNIKIYYLNIGKKGNIHYQSNKDLLKYFFRAYKLAKKLKRQSNYDLVHAFFGIPCGFIALLLKLPYIVSLRGSDVPFYNRRFYFLDKFIFQYLSKIIWQKAKAVVANSRGLKVLALKTSPRQKIDVIYNGVDLKQFFPNAKTGNDFAVISTARLIKRKGIEYLINAFLNFQKYFPDSRLLIAGDGDLKNYFIKIVKNSGLEDKVDFLGSISHEKLSDVYRRADVFVLPSLNEGMSNALLEAMASGLAIIATDTGGTGELVSTSVNGIIIEKNSEQAIYDALKTLYQDRELLNKMKQASLEKITDFSWLKVSAEYQNKYL